jgi:thioredoxin 1
VGGYADTVQELDAASFDAAVAGGPVIVDFWAPWCKPCKAIEPILEELPLTVARVNIDEHPEIAMRYEVLSIPTVMLFEGGEPRETVIGARPRAHFERAFASWIGSASNTP